MRNMADPGTKGKTDDKEEKSPAEESEKDELGEEGIISFGLGGDDGDDDELADLFSFGAGAGGGAASSSAADGDMDYMAMMASVMPLPRTQQEIHDDIFDDIDTDAPAKDGPKKEIKIGDKEQQEILAWLDEDDSSDLLNENEETDFNPPTRAKPTPAVVKEPPAPEEPQFKTLDEALVSTKVSADQIRKLLRKEKYSIKTSLRPNLWCHLVLGKSLEEAASSKDMERFQQWEAKSKVSDEEADAKVAGWVKERSKALSGRVADITKGDARLCEEALCSIIMYQISIKRKLKLILDAKGGDASAAAAATDGDDDENQSLSQKLLDPILPPVAAAILSTGVAKPIAAGILRTTIRDLCPLMALTPEERATSCQKLKREFYLLAEYHVPLLCFHLDRYMPQWCDWTALPTSAEAGTIPASWICSNFCGDCRGTKEAVMDSRHLIHLWDALLSTKKPMLHYFLTLAVLESNAERLLLLTGDDLRAAMVAITEFNDANVDGFAIETGDNTSEVIAWVQDWVQRATAILEATPSSLMQSMSELTQTVVMECLTKRKADFDEHKKQQEEAMAKAQQDAIDAERERKADEARLRLTRARLVAFYRQYNPGKENNIEKIMTAYEGRYEVLDAKLKSKYGVGFNPALKPKVVPKAAPTSTLLSSMNQGITNRRKNFFSGKRRDDDAFVIPENEKVKCAVATVAAAEVLKSTCWSKQAAAASMKKTATPSSSSLSSSTSSMSLPGDDGDERVPLKYYLIDCRPEQASQDQGRFPTAMALPPDTFLDADLLQKQEEMIEPLRGTVHIVIMGEGYKTLPNLYGQKMTQGLHEYIKEDESRNNLCALFFVKKGFPFVSIMEGGFAAAHAWLRRDGAEFHLRANNVLTDYNPSVSLFGQLEALYEQQQELANASAKAKTQRAIQNLFDSSMVALTKGVKNVESRGSSADATDGLANIQTSMVNKFFRHQGGKDADSLKNKNRNSKDLGDAKTAPPNDSNGLANSKTDAAESADNDEKAQKAGHSAFRNPFQAVAASAKQLTKTESERSLEVESVEFGEDGQPSQSKPKPKPVTEDSSAMKRPPINTFGSMFSKARQTPKDNGDAGSAAVGAGTAGSAIQPTTAAPKTTPTKSRGFGGFGGFGAAINSSMKAGQSKAGSTVPINPLARFGRLSVGVGGGAGAGGGSGASASTTANAANAGDDKGANTNTMANRFAGLNQFRKNTMAMVRNNTSRDTAEKESQNFPAQSEPKAPTDNPADDTATATSTAAATTASPAVDPPLNEDDEATTEVTLSEISGADLAEADAASAVAAAATATSIPETEKLSDPPASEEPSTPVPINAQNDSSTGADQSRVSTPDGAENGKDVVEEDAAVEDNETTKQEDAEPEAANAESPVTDAKEKTKEDAKKEKKEDTKEESATADPASSTEGDEVAAESPRVASVTMV